MNQAVINASRPDSLATGHQPQASMPLVPQPIQPITVNSSSQQKYRKIIFFLGVSMLIMVESKVKAEN